MIEIASRARRLPPPPAVVWDSLTQPRRPGTRPWLDLIDDEVEPRVLEAGRPDLVVWTSLWPSRPRDQVRLVLEPAYDGTGTETVLRFTLLTPDEPPDEETSRRLRRRLSVLLFADLRYSYGQ